MSVGERVRALRESKGMTQQELAERLGYKHKSSLAHIENNERDIPRSTIVRLADILDTTPSYLMGWTDEPQKNNAPDDIRSVIINHIDQLTDSQLNRLLGYLDALLSE